MNENTSQFFTYSSSSSPPPSLSTVAAMNSSYLSLNMLNNNNNNNHVGYDHMGRCLIENESWKYDSSPDDHVALGTHYSMNMSSNMISHSGGGSDELNTTAVPQEKMNKKAKPEKKIKKPKHAFQTRSQVDILDDGYRWRKYGQKAVKNNKFPRNYYRCTHQGCNVKKQVQRLSNDDGVVVTTYEGVHSHPIEKSTDNFENILTQMQIYSPYN